MVVALLLSLGVAGAPPLAEDPAYQHAIALYEAVELEKAAQAFEGLANDERPAGERSLVLTWMGLTLAQLARDDDAKAAFSEAAKLNPDVELPAAAPPGVVALFDEAKSLALAPPPDPEPEPDEPASEPDVGEESTPPDGSQDEAALPWNLFAGAGLVGVGVLIAAAGGAVAALGLVTREDAYAAEFNDDATRLRDEANFQFAGAGVLAGVGVVVIAGGAALAFIPLE